MNGREGSALRRTDIDGLRGLAIALVVVFHVFVGRVSAGVDVFLLLGGIFFFAPQVRNALNPVGLTVIQSFLRIFRRLYPALVTVVAVSLVVSVAVYAPVRWSETGIDAAASLLYIQNLNLIAQGSDYAAISAEVSVFQHIWSMSVQMQVYVGSLLVIAVLAAVLRRRAAVYGVLVVATVASFAYAAWLGAVDQGANYYSPLSRFWEIGLGGLFGIWVLGRTLPGVWRWMRWFAGVGGLVLIVAAGLFLDGAEQFPGPWTLVPLAGAMLVILAGNPVAGREDAGLSGVSRVLGARPFQFLGQSAYSLYLWHWPLLTLATYLFASSTTGTATGAGTAGTEPAGWFQGITATLGTWTGIVTGVTVIVVSLVLAWLTHRLVELPLQQTRRPERSWVVTDRRYMGAAVRSGGKASVALVMVAVTGIVMAFGPAVARVNESRAADQAEEEVNRGDYPGPEAFLKDARVPEDVPVIPDTAEARPMMPVTQDDGCFAGFDETELILTEDFNESEEPCAYGDVGSDRTMYLAGGSHSEHFLPALEEIGREQGIRIVPIVKMGCVVGMALPRVSGDEYPECAEWEQKAQDYIMDNPPTDGVFMTVTRPTTIRGDGPDQIPADYVDVIERFSDAGIHTWGVRDTPWLMSGPGEMLNGRVCVGESSARGGVGAGAAADECGVDQQDALLDTNPALAPLDGLDVTHVDLTTAVCRDGQCPALVGNVLVYRDSQHLTDRFAEMLAPEIMRQMFDPQALEAMEQEAEQAVEEALDRDGDDIAPKEVFRLEKPEPVPEPVPEPAPVPAPEYVDPGYVDPGYVDPGWVDPGWAPPY